MPLALVLLAGAWFAHSVARGVEAVTDDPDVAPSVLPVAVPSLALGLALAWWLARR